MGNIVKAVVGKNGKIIKTAPLYQYDYGQILQIEGIELPAAYQVHFSNDPMGDSTTSIGDESGVTIPDTYLASGETVYAWLFLHTGEDDGETVLNIVIPVRQRAAITNETPTPQQQGEIDQIIEELNEAVDAAEDAQAAAEEAAEQAEAQVEKYPIIVDGYWAFWDEASEQYVKSNQKAQGPKGDPGDPGDPSSLIDDAAAAAGKTYSSSKIEAELTPLKSDIEDIEDDVSDLKTQINSRPETSPTTETAVDLDVTDPDGNVLVRMKDGQIETKNFDSSLVSDTRPSTAENTDLDITDADGNVLLRLQNGNIKTKYFDSTDPLRVPDYYHANGYLKGKCDRLNALARGCAKKSDTFAFVTDLHWHLNAGKSPALLKYIKENTRIDKFFCGGDVCDFIDSEHQPYDAWTQFYEALKMPTYAAMGNHDYMSSYGTEGRLYYSFNSVGRDRIGNFDRNYFYIDNPQSQIRYVFLNGFQPNGNGSWTWGLEQDQIDWMNNTALDLETGWGAIIVTHMIIGIDLDSTPYQIYKPTMATNLLNELDSYNGNGEIIAVVCGHTHFDYLDYSTGGIPIIVTTSDKYLPWIQSGVDKEPWLSDRVEGTITEQAIDLFVVDREAKTITRVRVGCPIHYGTDPETWTEHEEVTVSYDRS